MNAAKRLVGSLSQVPRHRTKCCMALSGSLKTPTTACAHILIRHHSTQGVCDSDSSILRPDVWRNYLNATDAETETVLGRDMLVFPDFLSEAEEQSLLQEVEPYMKRLRYEFDHWDNAIHGYRETEKLKWNEDNKKILQRVRELAFPPAVPQIAYVHVLDISREGYIKPHVDAVRELYVLNKWNVADLRPLITEKFRGRVRFCGNTIAGLSLLSSCVMRLALETDSSRYGDVLLSQRSLYIMRHRARYEYTHEVLPAEQSVFKGQGIARDRRLSVICRNEPNQQD